MGAQRSVRTRLTLDVNDYVQGTVRAEAATEKFGSNAGRVLRGLATGYAAIKLGGLITESVQLEAAYSKTMAQVAVATDAPKAKLAELDDLALKLGADTVFSAQDSAAAMLSLAKGGLSPAQIQAGALADTLTLASAGELELADAADTVVQGMGAFRLKASQTNVAVAALAGGANASSASVSDMTQALAQAGTSANSAGLSIQETTAYLALFADQGIKGSDAGTSLRTMLTGLVPKTKEAKDAMASLGLTYLDANGNLVNAEEIAKRTQDAFGGLSDAQRIAASNAIFGADASRAVNAITAEGEEGLRKYITATSDLTQAQKLADAANSGTAGALEQLSGSVETAQILIGRGLAPTVQEFANKASGWLEGADIEGWAQDAGAGLADLVDELTPLAVSAFEVGREALPTIAEAGGTVVDVLKLAADIITPVLDGFNELPDAAQKALILAAGAKTLSNRLGPIPGLAGSAGGGLFAFGGSARKAGDDADKAKGKFSGLAASLKGYGLLTVASLVIPSTLGDLEDTYRSLKGTTEDFTKSFDKTGRANADTVESLGSAFQDSAIGKYAGDLGVNLDQLAVSLSESGSKGEYVKQIMDEYQHSYRDLGTKVGSWLPFVDTDSERATKLKNALEEMSEEYDKASEKARAQALAVDENKNAFDLIVNGLGQYSDELKGLPSKAITEILTPGAIKGKTDVLALADAYELTPDQVTTVMHALGFDDKKIKAVQKAMRELDGTTATVTEIHEKIERTIKESYDKRGSDGGKAPSLKDMLSPYTGMRMPSGYAGGGVVPGISPSNPSEDNIFAMGATSGQPLMVRSGEWIINEQQSQKNDRWLRLINSGLNLDDLLPGFADGGRYDTYTSLTKSSKLDLLEQEQRIRNIERSLKDRETVGKGKNKHSRLSLRGFDRTVAEEQLKDERSELARMKRENKELGKYGTSGQEKRREEAREAAELAAEKAADAAADAAEERQRAVSSASGDITDGFSLNGITSAAGLERTLDRVVADSAEFIQVIADLKAKGASDWVLNVLKKAGPSKTTIRVGRQLLADEARFTRINAASSTLTQLGGAYGELTAGSGSLSTGTRELLVQIQALDVTQVTGEIQRVVRHELAAIGGGANI